MKDQSPSTTPSTPEPRTPEEGEGGSFLTDPDPKPEIAPEGLKDGDKSTDKPKPEAAPAGAPEKYADFTLPEGYTFEPKQLEAAQKLFKDSNLSQEQAQSLVNFYADNALQAAKAPFDAWANLQKEWTDQIAERFPGDQAREVKGMISNVINTMLPPSLAKGLRTALNITGAGSHPDVVEALSIMLKPLSEGKPVRGGGPSGEGQKPPGSGPPSIADAIYGHLRK